MRISIAMLAEQLTDLKPELHVVTGGRVLRNARLLADSQSRSRSTLYLQQNSTETVACVNGNDILFLHTDDQDAALNSILDVFDEFDEWSDEAEALIADGRPLHDLVASIAHKMNAYLIVADATYLIREWATGPTSHDGLQMEEIRRARSMPLDMILRIDADPMVRRKDAGVYHEALDDENYSIVCNIFVGDEHKGWVVANRFGSVYSQGDYDFLEAATGFVERWMQANQGRDEHWEQTAVLRQLVEGTAPDEALARRALSVFGWGESDDLRVYAIRQDALSKRPLFVIRRFLSQAIPHSFILELDGGLMVVADESLGQADAYRREMMQILESCGFHAGQSPIFSDVMSLKSQYESACVAAEVANAENPLVAFDDVKLPYALSILRTNAVADVRHGALDVLATYDERHGTQLYETLKCFVANRGGYARTYNQLFIHRSTLQYRLERIAELCDLDFDDPTLWAHLELSFLLDVT